MASWYDIVPRLGSAYDLFGDGKTALKVSLNKYVIAQGLQGTYGDTANPVNRLANIVTRSWTDGNGNFVPDCDLTNPLVQDFRSAGRDLCGTVSDVNFGRPTLSLNYDPDVLTGWGTRPYQWEFSASVQREISRGLSVDFGYFRRWFGNYGVTDNLSLGPADYTSFGVAAPLDPRPPDGGGYTVNGFYNLNPDKVTVVPNNSFTLANNYGEQTAHWNGFDVGINIRPRNGLTIQGGVGTGRMETDNCDVMKTLPDASSFRIFGAGAGAGGNEVVALTAPYCHQKDNFLTDGKVIGTYNIPKIDVTISGLFYSRPGPAIMANKVFLSSEVAPSLGRPLSANAQTITLNLVRPGWIFGDRRNQLDIRFTKMFRVERTRIATSSSTTPSTKMPFSRKTTRTKIPRSTGGEFPRRFSRPGSSS